MGLRPNIQIKYYLTLPYKYTAAEGQNVVTAYFVRKQLLPFDLEEQYTLNCRDGNI